MKLSSATARVRSHYEKTASRYDGRIGFFEHVLFGDGRRWVCEQAAGEVLELAVGTGRNLPFYPESVQLTGIELSPEMLAIARERQREIGREADLHEGDAQDLRFENESFDSVVFTLALCTIPDERRALAEAFRVLRPGGRLLLLEHVRSPARPVRAVQRLLDPLFVRLEADHLLRDPLDHLLDLGFELGQVERSKWGIVQRLAARRPEAD